MVLHYGRGCMLSSITTLYWSNVTMEWINVCVCVCGHAWMGVRKSRVKRPRVKRMVLTRARTASLPKGMLDKSILMTL